MARLVDFFLGGGRHEYNSVGNEKLKWTVTTCWDGELKGVFGFFSFRERWGQALWGRHTASGRNGSRDPQGPQLIGQTWAHQSEQVTWRPREHRARPPGAKASVTLARARTRPLRNGGAGPWRAEPTRGAPSSERPANRAPPPIGRRGNYAESKQRSARVAPSSGLPVNYVHFFPFSPAILYTRANEHAHTHTLTYIHKANNNFEIDSKYSSSFIYINIINI